MLDLSSIHELWHPAEGASVPAYVALTALASGESGATGWKRVAMLAVIATILAGSLIYFVTESIKPDDVRPAGGSATPANDLILAGEQLQLAIRQAGL